MMERKEPRQCYGFSESNNEDVSAIYGDREDKQKNRFVCACVLELD